MITTLNKTFRRVPVWLVYVIGFLPAALTLHAAINNRLGADPLAALEHESGIWALRFLIGALAITPLLRILRINLMKFRRALGLLGFYYVTMHLFVWIWLDHWFAWGRMGAEILKRPFITIGMLAFVILVPLAVTSNNLSVRRLGGDIWRRVHWWAYVATALGAVHFLLVVKRWPPEPLIYTAIVAGLLAWRAVRGASTRAPRDKTRPVKAA